MSGNVFRDRREAGQTLGRLLDRYRGEPGVIVLALPRGGVPVGYEVARALAAPLDVLVVRKLGSPTNPELALGAIASGGVTVTNADVLQNVGADLDTVERVRREEEPELRNREYRYRGDRPMRDIADHAVILVDDGMATGATMNAAIRAVGQLEPSSTTVALPAAPETGCQELAEVVDDVVCAITPAPFFAVGSAYRHFEPTTDTEVSELLAAAADAEQRPNQKT